MDQLNQKHDMQYNHAKVPSAYVVIHTMNQKEVSRGPLSTLRQVQLIDLPMDIHHI